MDRDRMRNALDGRRAADLAHIWRRSSIRWKTSEHVPLEPSGIRRSAPGETAACSAGTVSS